MIHTRIIPRLDIKGPNLVKGIHLEGLRVIGKPEHFAKYYYEQGADELIYMDVVASLYGRNSLDDIIRKTANEIFIPLTVGGGLRTIEDIRRVLSIGADKVALNTAAIQNPNLITEAAEIFGASTVVISIEALKKDNGTCEAFTNNGREETGVDVIEWAKRVEKLGAGEILLTSINREGTGKGYDVELIKKISEEVSIPVIASGGAGCKEDVFDVINRGRADAVCVASMFHYDYLKKNELLGDFSSEGNIDFLKGERGYQRAQSISLEGLKEYLHNKEIDCRCILEVET